MMQWGIFSFNLRLHDDESKEMFLLNVACDGHVGNLGGSDNQSTREYLVDEGYLIWQSTGPEDTELFLSPEWMERTYSIRKEIAKGFEPQPWKEVK